MKSIYVKEQLGMAGDKARYKLGRILLLELAKKLNAHMCYRCGKPIENVEEFSIDHKQPWLHVDPKLFWDVENIAFSHHRCNSKHHR